VIGDEQRFAQYRLALTVRDLGVEISFRIGN
jgi:hypothetical protein